MRTKSTDLLSYRISWFAALFASHADYESLSLADDGILLEEGKSVRTKIPYLSIGSDVGLDRGVFWDALTIPLESGKTIHLGGVAKKQSGRIQKKLNQVIRRHIESFYQGLAPDLQQAYQQARVLFSGQHYIRYAVAEQWLNHHRHLADGINRHDVQDFLPREALQNLHLT